jgi:hypothetical protein
MPDGNLPESKHLRLTITLFVHREDIKNFYNKEKAVAIGKELTMAQNLGLPHDLPLAPSANSRLYARNCT